MGVTPRDIYSVRLDQTQIDAIDAIARDEGRTRSDVIRRLVAEALRTRASKR